MIPLPKSTKPRPAVKERGALWQKRGLFMFFLPPYNSHLNIAEILWRNLKYEWLCPGDYADKETPHLRVGKLCGRLGRR